MHESPVARQIVTEAVRQADANGSTRITAIIVSLGPEGGYVPDSLDMHIQAMAVGTPAESAEVRIKRCESGGPVLESIEVEVNS